MTYDKYSQKSTNKEYLKNRYLDCASNRFKSLLVRLFQLSNDENTTIFGFKMFFENDVFSLNDIWESSGLCTLIHTGMYLNPILKHIIIFINSYYLLN